MFLGLPASSVLVDWFLTVLVTISRPVVLSALVADHHLVDGPHLPLWRIPLVSNDQFSKLAWISLVFLASLLLATRRIVDFLFEVFYAYRAVNEVRVAWAIALVPIVIQSGQEQPPPNKCRSSGSDTIR